MLKFRLGKGFRLFAETNLEVWELEVEGHVGHQHQPDGLDEYSHCKPNHGLILAKLKIRYVL